jgi:hypothetical protein
MTFVAHKVSGGVLHLAIGKALLILFATMGLHLHSWLILCILYIFTESGSYFGGFPDTEDWITTKILGITQRWEIYHRCHVTDLRKKYIWIPAWALHLFCDLFAHPPKEGESLKWYQMNPVWKNQKFVFGLTIWDAQYAVREGFLYLITSIGLYEVFSWKL